MLSAINVSAFAWITALPRCVFKWLVNEDSYDADYHQLGLGAPMLGISHPLLPVAGDTIQCDAL